MINGDRILEYIGLGERLPRTTPAPPLTASTRPAEMAEVEQATRIQVPYRTQFDGSTYAWGNCGVAAISMVMAYYGQSWSTHVVREEINEMTGNWGTEVGVDWRYLQRAVEQRGFRVRGPVDRAGGYQVWTLDDLRNETRQGRPVMLLVHYRSMPGHENDEWWGDHYILFLGLTSEGNVIYHDPGFPGSAGAYRTVDVATFEQAWSHTWVGQNRTAMVIVPG